MGGTFCQAWAINDANQVAGWSMGSDGIGHGFIWQDGNFKDLGYFQAYPSRAPVPTSINGTGKAVGYVQDATDVFAFLWDGTLHLLDPKHEFAYSTAVAINDAGTIIGMASKSEEWNAVPARYDGSHLVLLQDEVENIASWQLLAVYGINNKGEIVGAGYNAATNTYGSFKLVPQ